MGVSTRALRSLRSETQLAAGKQREPRFSSHEEKVKWMEDYVETETAVARKRVENAEAAIQQQQEHMRNAEKAGLTITKPGTTFEEMVNAIGDRLSDVACSTDGEDGEHEDHDDDEDTELG